MIAKQIRSISQFNCLVYCHLNKAFFLFVIQEDGHYHCYKTYQAAPAIQQGKATYSVAGNTSKST